MPLGTGIIAVGQHELTLNTHPHDFRRKLHLDPTLLCVLCAHAGNIFATVFVEEKLFKKFRQLVAGPGKAPGKLSQSCWSANAGEGWGTLDLKKDPGRDVRWVREPQTRGRRKEAGSRGVKVGAAGRQGLLMSRRGIRGSRRGQSGVIGGTVLAPPGHFEREG